MEHIKLFEAFVNKGISKSEFEKLPKYVKFEGGSALRLGRKGDENERYELQYYRDAGRWGVDFVEKDGELFSKSKEVNLDNKKLIPITREEWMKDNSGNIDKNTAAITYSAYKSGGPAFGYVGVD